MKGFILLELLESVCDPTFGQIIRGHFNGDVIPGQNANTVFPHTSGCVGNNLVVIYEFYAECRIREEFNDFSFKFQ